MEAGPAMEAGLALVHAKDAKVGAIAGPAAKYVSFVMITFAKLITKIPTASCGNMFLIVVKLSPAARQGPVPNISVV